MTKRKWIICPACEGEGTCVNPAIDSQGLTAENFAEDPDFAEEYFNGTYNQKCAACDGSGKITEEDLAELEQAASDRALAAREDGDFEAYSGSHDYRWGF